MSDKHELLDWEDVKASLREAWHVRSYNMAQTITDYSTVESAIADFWIGKLEKIIRERENIK